MKGFEGEGTGGGRRCEHEKNVLRNKECVIEKERKEVGVFRGPRK
jgi:hypothetical protein